MWRFTHEVLRWADTWSGSVVLLSSLHLNILEKELMLLRMKRQDSLWRYLHLRAVLVHNLDMVVRGFLIWLFGRLLRLLLWILNANPALDSCASCQSMLQRLYEVSLLILRSDLRILKALVVLSQSIAHLKLLLTCVSHVNLLFWEMVLVGTGLNLLDVASWMLALLIWILRVLRGWCLVKVQNLL